MQRCHLAALFAAICWICPMLYSGPPFAVAQKPKTILSDDFLTMPGDDLPALKEYVARLMDCEPQTMDEYEKWVRVRETAYSSLRDASENLLKIAAEPAGIALGQKGKLIALENLAGEDKDFAEYAPQLKAYADDLIREAPDSENTIYARAVLLEIQYRELYRRQIHHEDNKTKEDYLRQLKEINDDWLVLEKSMRDFIEKYPGTKTRDLLSVLIVGMCFYEMETDQEKLAVFRECLEQSDMEEAKEVLPQYDYLVEGYDSYKVILKLRRLHNLAGDNKQAIDEVRREFRRYLDTQRAAFQDNRNHSVKRMCYVDYLENALRLFGSEEWILEHFQVLKEFYCSSDDPEMNARAERLDGMIRLNTLTGNAMEFEAYQLDGTKIDIRDFRGKVVLMDYWATWCGPCIASFPAVEACYEKYREQGFEVIAYSIDEDLETLRDYEEKHTLPWISTSSQLTQDKGGRNYADYYGISGIPHYILVGRDGNVLTPATHPAMPDFSEMLENALRTEAE
ncbi:MAG: TlpA family protein disulfide reductase [Planctomycetaceae bacterium]|nr:TlpA family protein disulfide reductase [Planctomycetaceae bacterium]